MLSHNIATGIDGRRWHCGELRIDTYVDAAMRLEVLGDDAPGEGLGCRGDKYGEGEQRTARLPARVNPNGTTRVVW